MMSDEDIDKIAKRVLELQQKEGLKLTNGRCSIADIIHKYHKRMYDKFGTTGQIESSIRTVAVYKVGVRHIAQIPENKFEECRKYAERIYKDILGSDEDEYSNSNNKTIKF